MQVASRNPPRPLPGPWRRQGWAQAAQGRWTPAEAADTLGRCALPGSPETHPIGSLSPPPLASTLSQLLDAAANQGRRISHPPPG